MPGDAKVGEKFGKCTSNKRSHPFVLFGLCSYWMIHQLFLQALKIMAWAIGRMNEWLFSPTTVTGSEVWTLLFVWPPGIKRLKLVWIFVFQEPWRLLPKLVSWLALIHGLCDPMDFSPLGSSAHGIFQAGILEWVAISFLRGSSQPRDWTHVSCIVRQIL